MTELFCQRSVDCDQGSVRAVRYNVDGSYLLTCGSDKKLKLWNPHTGFLLKAYGGHADEVTDAAGSCDSCHIVSASLDKSIIYWDVSTGAPVRRLRCHAGGVTAARFNEDSGLVVSGAKDNLVMCWDIRSRRLEPIQVLNEATDCITSIVVTNVGVVVSSLDGHVRHYDLRAGEVRCDRLGPPVVHAVQTRDGQCTVAACADSVVRLVDNGTGALLAQYRGHGSADFKVECAVMAGDAQVAAGGRAGEAVVWDLVEEKVVARLAVGKGVVCSMAAHPTRDEVAFGWHRSYAVWGKVDAEAED